MVLPLFSSLTSNAPGLGLVAPLFPLSSHSPDAPIRFHGLQYIYLHTYESQTILFSQYSLFNYMLTYPATYLLNICTGCLADTSNWTHSKLNSWSFPHSQRLFHPSPPHPTSVDEHPSSFSDWKPWIPLFPTGKFHWFCHQNIPRKKYIYIRRIWPLFPTSTASPSSEPSPITRIAAIASLLISLLLPRPLTFCAQHYTEID